MFPSLFLALSLAAGPVSVQFEGPLKQGLSTIAEKGGLNVIVVGDLNEPAQIHLTSVTAEEALETVAKVYQLQVTKQGKLYVLKRLEPAKADAVKGEPVKGSDPTDDEKPADVIGAVNDLAKSAEVNQLVKQIEKLEKEQERLEAETDRLTDEAEQKEELEADRAERLKELAEAKAEHLKAQGRAKGEVISAGGPVEVKSGESVKDAVAYGGPVIIDSNARVQGDAVAFGGDVVIKREGVVEGDAVSFGGKVVREEGAEVHGEEVSFGGSGLASSMAAHAVKASRSVEAAKDEDSKGGLGLATFLVQFVVFFVFGFLSMVFAPQRMKGLESAIRGQPVLSGAVGFLGFLLVAPLSLFLIITLIGIPVALVMWILLALAIPMGLAALANTVGTSVPLGRVRRTQAMVLALGLLVMMVLSHVPVIGPLALSLAACVSLGAVLRTRLGSVTPKGLPVSEVERLPV